MKGHNFEYEALNPWADADAVPLVGLSQRVTDLTGKTIGLLANVKKAAEPILAEVEEKLKQRYPTIKIRWGKTRSTVMQRGFLALEEEPVDQVFRDWTNEVDTVVAAVGD